MRPLFGIGFLVAFLLALLAGPVGVAVAADPSRELIVRFDQDATAAGRLDAREDARTDFERAPPLQGMRLVSVESGQSVAVAKQELESDPDVLYAEPNAIRHASLVPDDPYFSQLWALLNTGQAIRGVTGTPDADSDVAEAWDARIAGDTIVAVLDRRCCSCRPRQRRGGRRGRQQRPERDLPVRVRPAERPVRRGQRQPRQLAPFSNYGTASVDLATPGVSIASTWPGGGYSWASGTSMATPHVSGAAGLLWSAAPSSQPIDISSAIMAGTDASPAFAGKTVSGGRLNVLRALRLVADVGVGEPAPAPAPGGGASGGGSGGGGSGTGGSAGSGGRG